MWKLKSIEAENLCAFRSLAYTLQQGVTTLIFGNNKDNDHCNSYHQLVIDLTFQGHSPFCG